MPKISIITPCFNAEKLIAETVRSVLTQSAVLSGRAELDYIICDGKSTDRTVQIIEQMVGENRAGSVRVLSEADSGMYEALAKGLRTASGDICGYINAGDYYNEHAFDVILDVFEAYEFNWLTGMMIICNENSQVVSAAMPFGYRSRLIKTGLYGRRLPFIQQESTFWRRGLNEKIDYGALSRYKYAGDYFLWHQFAQYECLALVEAYLGAFKIHIGQISEDRSKYFSEIASFCDRPNCSDILLACFDKILWRLPSSVQALFHCNPVIRYNHMSQTWQPVNRRRVGTRNI